MSNIVFGILIAFLLVCLVILFCIILIQLYISKIKKYNKIIYQKEVDQQKAINQAIIETQEDVLDRIAKDLHDDAGQQFTYINLQVENLKLTNPNVKKDLAPISQSLSHLSTSIRNLSHSISSQKMKNYKLIENIKNELQKVNTVRCNLDIPQGFNHTFSSNENIILYRIFQEILNNTLKHANAKTFSLAIQKTLHLKFTFQDDGIGFSQEKMDVTETSGIQNIKKRAELINFSCETHSEKGKGVTIILCKNVM